MATATPIETDIGRWPQPDARLYRLAPPVGETDHVVVWVEPNQPHLAARAVAIATDERGAVRGSSLRPIATYSHPYGPNHAGVLWLLGGYEIGEVEVRDPQELEPVPPPPVVYPEPVPPPPPPPIPDPEPEPEPDDTAGGDA